MTTPFSNTFQTKLFIHSPVIISQTTGAIASSLCICLFVAATCGNYIPFAVCWPCDSHRHFKEALNLCSESDSASQSPIELFAKRRSETWQAQRQVDTGWWIFKKWDNMWGQQLSLFQAISRLCVSWRVSRRSGSSITCVRELRGQLGSPVSRSVTMGACLNGSFSVGQ